MKKGEIHDATHKCVWSALGRSFSPHDLRHRRISLLHRRGMPWARIGEFVGQRNLATTANTYSHVPIDEAEVDCADQLNVR